jgi:hypothetical protein
MVRSVRDKKLGKGAREQGGRGARERGSERARERESERAREQGRRVRIPARLTLMPADYGDILGILRLNPFN